MPQSCGASSQMANGLASRRWCSTSGGAGAIAFGSTEAALAADLYRRLKRPRQREIAIAIAACAIAWNAAFWTLNPEDFTDIPNSSWPADRVYA